MYEYCVAVDAFILLLSFANFSAEVVKSLTTRVYRLEKQYDLLLQQYFVLASAHNSIRSSSSHFLPTSSGESVMPAPSLLTTLSPGLQKIPLLLPLLFPLLQLLLLPLLLPFLLPLLFLLFPLLPELLLLPVPLAFLLPLLFQLSISLCLRHMAHILHLDIHLVLVDNLKRS